MKSEMTSKDTMISSGSIVCWRMKVENDFELLVCCSFCLPYGFSISAIYFDTSSSGVPVYDTIERTGIPSLWILDRP